MKTIELNKAQQLVAEGMLLSDADRQTLQQERLHELVDYVRQNSPYFAKLYAHLPETYSLTDLPITKKAELLENYDDWVSYRQEVNGSFLDIRHCSNSIERDWYIHIDNGVHCSVGSMDIEYVHQLQNTCKLAGFEIEIKI